MSVVGRGQLEGRMPLTKKGKEIMAAMVKKYGVEKGREVFYASRNKGTISGVDPESRKKAMGSLKNKLGKHS